MGSSFRSCRSSRFERCSRDPSLFDDLLLLGVGRWLCWSRRLISCTSGTSGLLLRLLLLTYLGPLALARSKAVNVIGWVRTYGIRLLIYARRLKTGLLSSGST